MALDGWWPPKFLLPDESREGDRGGGQLLSFFLETLAVISGVGMVLWFLLVASSWSKRRYWQHPKSQLVTARVIDRTYWEAGNGQRRYQICFDYSLEGRHHCHSEYPVVKGKWKNLQVGDSLQVMVVVVVTEDHKGRPHTDETDSPHDVLLQSELAPLQALVHPACIGLVLMGCVLHVCLYMGSESLSSYGQTLNQAAQRLVVVNAKMATLLVPMLMGGVIVLYLGVWLPLRYLFFVFRRMRHGSA